MTQKYTPEDAAAKHSSARVSEAIGIRMGSAMCARGHIGATVQEEVGAVLSAVIELLGEMVSDADRRQAAMIQVGHALQVTAINQCIRGESVTLGDMIAVHAGVVRAQLVLSGINTLRDQHDTLHEVPDAVSADMLAGLNTALESHFDGKAYAEEGQSQCACCDTLETEVDRVLARAEKNEATDRPGTPRVSVTTGAEAVAMAREVGVDPNVPEGATLGCIEFDERPTREQVIRAIMQATGVSYEQVDAQVPQDVSEMLHDTVQMQVRRTRTDGPKTVH